MMSNMNRRARAPPTRAFICAVIAIAAVSMRSAASLVLLSDLPTPSFIIDTDALRRKVGGPPPPNASDEDAPPFAPPIRCPKNDLLLRPSMIGASLSSEAGSMNTVDCEFEVIEGKPAIGYLHTSVVGGRDGAVPGVDDPVSTYLAEIDLDPGLCRGEGPAGAAQLVLGLNNHHVIGYYWARAAGAGSSMEAPGVWFGKDNGSSGRVGVLRWLDPEGFTACNSNDGKRSEWVNFLRPEDQVQLVPADGQGTLEQFTKRFGKQSAGGEASMRVYGISMKRRPMGSEPEVICEWNLGAVAADKYQFQRARLAAQLKQGAKDTAAAVTKTVAAERYQFQRARLAAQLEQGAKDAAVDAAAAEAAAKAEAEKFQRARLELQLAQAAKDAAAAAAKAVAAEKYQFQRVRLAAQLEQGAKDAAAAVAKAAMEAAAAEAAAKAEAEKFQRARLESQLAQAAKDAAAAAAKAAAEAEEAAAKELGYPSVAIMKARQQPKSSEEEAALKAKYSAMDLGEKAFTILADLGMIDLNPDPNDPTRDVSKDDEDME